MQDDSTPLQQYLSTKTHSLSNTMAGNSDFKSPTYTDMMDVRLSEAVGIPTPELNDILQTYRVTGDDSYSSCIATPKPGPSGLQQMNSQPVSTRQKDYTPVQFLSKFGNVVMDNALGKLSSIYYNINHRI